MYRNIILPLLLALVNVIVITQIESCSHSMHYYEFDVNYTCNSDAISTAISFKRPFFGAVFAKNYYANPNCSTPNMYVKPTSEINLEVPLLLCGTRVRRTRGRQPRIRSTLIIQYNPTLKTVNDTEVVMTCSPCESLSSEFWQSYALRDRTLKPRLNVRMEFKHGRAFLSPAIAGQLKVSNKMFLVVYVEDNHKYKGFDIRRCWGHNDNVINANTTIIRVSETKICRNALLDSITLEPRNNELRAFTLLNLFSVNAKNLYITCALDFCKECSNPCLNGTISRDFSPWTSVGVYRAIRAKRSTDESKDEINEIYTGSDHLKSKVRSLTERFLKLKSQINANKSFRGLQKTAFKSFTEAPLEENKYKNKNEIVYFSPNNVKSKTDFSRRNLKSQEGFNSANNSESVRISTHTETESRTTRDLSNCLETFCTTFDDLASTETENSNYESISTEVIMPMNITSIYSKMKILRNTNDTSNITTEFVGNTSLQNTIRFELDCVPQLKFLIVTISLSLLIVFMFFICIGALLHAQKETKRKDLDSYYLFNSF